MDSGIDHWSIATLFLLVAFDMQNLAANLRRGVKPRTRRTDDFTILVPIFGHPRYLQNAKYLEQYKSNVLILINATSRLLAEFADRLEEDGWKVYRTSLSGRISPADMVHAGVEQVATTWAVRLDGDAYSEQDFGQAVAAAEDAGKDFCSVRILPSQRHSLAEKMQGVEYDMAMRARRFRPWLTSGACVIGRTEALRQILRNHSRWFYGEDMEMGLVAKHYRMKVGHIDHKVFTQVPETFRKLARQRLGWWAGHFRQNVVNMDHMAHYPIHFIYTVGLIYLMLSTKWWHALAYWHFLPLVVGLYICITLIANWEVRSRWMLLFPLYALSQSLFFPIAGSIWFIRIRIQNRRRARFVVRWRRERWVPASPG